MNEIPKSLTHSERALFLEYGNVFPDIGNVFRELSRVREAMAMIGCGLTRAAFPNKETIFGIETGVSIIAEEPIVEDKPVKPQKPRKSFSGLFAQYDACLPPRGKLNMYQYRSKTISNIMTKLGPQPTKAIYEYFGTKGWRRECVVEAMNVLHLKREKNMIVPTIMPLPPIVEWRTSVTGTTQGKYTNDYLLNFVSGRNGQIDMNPAFAHLLSVGIRLPTIYQSISLIGGRKEKGLPERVFTFK